MKKQANGVRRSRLWMIQFCGIVFTEEEPDLDRMMFGDATLVSKNAISSLIKNVKTNITTALDHFGLNTDDKVGSYIVVRRPDCDPENDDAEREKALRRARELAALLSFCYLWGSSIPVAFALRHDAVSIRSAIASVSDAFDDIRSRLANESPVIFSPNAFTQNRQQIFARLQRPELAALAAPFLTNKGRTSFAKRLVRATVDLQKAMSSNNTDQQLLGSWMCIEMLLSNTYTGSSEVSRLAQALATISDGQWINVQRIYDARNKLLHDAVGCDPETAIYAICAAFALICSFATINENAVPHLKNDREALCAYLNLVSRGITGEHMEGFVQLHARKPSGLKQPRFVKNASKEG